MIVNQIDFSILHFSSTLYIMKELNMMNIKYTNNPYKIILLSLSDSPNTTLLARMLVIWNLFSFILISITREAVHASFCAFRNVNLFVTDSNVFVFVISSKLMLKMQYPIILFRNKCLWNNWTSKSAENASSSILSKMNLSLFLMHSTSGTLRSTWTIINEDDRVSKRIIPWVGVVSL